MGQAGQVSGSGRAGEENLEWMHHRMELIIKKLTFRQGHLRQGAELHNVTCLPHVRMLRQQHREERAGMRRGPYDRHVAWAGPPAFDDPEVPALEDYLAHHAKHAARRRAQPAVAAADAPPADEDEAAEGDDLAEDEEVAAALDDLIADGAMADDEPADASGAADGEPADASGGEEAEQHPAKRARRQAVPWWEIPDPRQPSAGSAAGAGAAGAAGAGAEAAEFDPSDMFGEG